MSQEGWENIKIGILMGFQHFSFKDQTFLDIKACKTNLDICMHEDLQDTGKGKVSRILVLTVFLKRT